MASFSRHSKRRLATCHEDLQRIAEVVIEWFDFTVLEGRRSQARQNELFRTGASQLRWPNSSHNTTPSKAIDVAPWPIDWEDRERFNYLAGALIQAAEILYSLGEIDHLLRWGGDWDRDAEVKDNEFDDLVHFELIEP